MTLLFWWWWCAAAAAATAAAIAACCCCSCDASCACRAACMPMSLSWFACAALTSPRASSTPVGGDTGSSKTNNLLVLQHKHMSSRKQGCSKKCVFVKGVSSCCYNNGPLKTWIPYLTLCIRADRKNLSSVGPNSMNHVCNWICIVKYLLAWMIQEWAVYIRMSTNRSRIELDSCC